jgi:hypothetical protein
MEIITNLEVYQKYIEELPSMLTKLEEVKGIMEKHSEYIKEQKFVVSTEETHKEEYERKEALLNRKEDLEKALKGRNEIRAQLLSVYNILEKIIRRKVEKHIRKTLKSNSKK